MSMLRIWSRKAFCLTAVIGTVFFSGTLTNVRQVGGKFRAAAAVYAQETSANIYGTIVDERGAVIPKVKIVVVNNETGLRREAVTNDAGYYTVPLLPAGKYTLTVEMSGFATLRVVDLALQVSINSNVSVTLSPRQVAESITVEAESNKVDTSNATRAYSITNEQVQGLPVITSSRGRNVLEILPLLVPGVTPTVSGSFLGSQSLRGELLSVNGSRTVSNSFNFEGGDNNDQERNRAASTLPNPEALQEFTILTNSYKADQGRSAGAVINAVVRSGTNEFHGNLRYILLNEALNARSFFDPIRRRARVNTYGGQMGGPVILPLLYNGKDRTHFFIDYEGTVSNQAGAFFRNVLTNEERAGDFSNLPAGQQPLDPLTGEPFLGGIIPASRISPISGYYLNLIPTPNEGERGFRGTRIVDFRNNQFTARVDHQIGKSDSLAATFLSTISETDFGRDTLPLGSNAHSETKNYNFVLRQTHTFSSRTINQFTGTVTRFNDDTVETAPGITGLHPREVGITGVIPQTEQFLGLPNIGFGSIFFADAGGQVSRKTTWQIKDDLSHVRGDHTFKFGAEMLSFIFNKTIANNNGNFFFGFNPSGTSNEVADFLLGIPSFYSQDTGNTQYPRQKSFSFYALDDWKPRPDLTINFGLRYELVPPLRDELDQVSVFRPGQKSNRFPGAPVGLLFAGDPDPVLGTVPRGVYPADKNNFAPRLGIAYSPNPKSGWLRSLFGESKTALRAGWGVFYDQTFGYGFSEFSFVQPFAVSIALDSFGGAPVGSFANPFGSQLNPFPIDLGRREFVGAPELETFDPTFRTAYTYQYNLTVQRELPWSLLMELAYVGSNSFKLNRDRELNPDTDEPDPFFLEFGIFVPLKTYSQFASIWSQESAGRAYYNALQTRLTRRFKAGLAFDVSYVFSRTLDNSSSPLGPTFRTFQPLLGEPIYTDQFRLARSSLDRTHQFVLSYTYDLPLTKRGGFVGRLLNGWQIGGIAQIRSGLPMDIYDESGATFGAVFGVPDFVGPYRRLDPREYQTIIVDGVPVSGNFFFDPNAFRSVPTPEPGQPRRRGNLGRNVFDGPIINQWDFSVSKRTRLFETHEIEIRADIENFPNHAQFSQPSPSIGSFFNPPGIVQSSVPGRTVQLSMRYRF